MDLQRANKIRKDPYAQQLFEKRQHQSLFPISMSCHNFCGLQGSIVELRVRQDGGQLHFSADPPVCSSSDLLPVTTKTVNG